MKVIACKCTQCKACKNLRKNRKLKKRIKRIGNKVRRRSDIPVEVGARATSGREGRYHWIFWA